MALHRAEQIMARVLVELLATVALTADIERERLDPWDSSGETFDGISVYMGDDQPGEFDNFSLMDRDLSVVIEVGVKHLTPETRLNALRKEITIALKNGNLEGNLSFVHQVVEGGWSQPALEPEKEFPALTSVGVYLVKYRRSTTDPSA